MRLTIRQTIALIGAVRLTNWARITAFLTNQKETPGSHRRSWYAVGGAAMMTRRTERVDIAGRSLWVACRALRVTQPCYMEKIERRVTGANALGSVAAERSIYPLA